MLIKFCSTKKGKLCESRGRKVTDLKGEYPKMAGLPQIPLIDLATIWRNHIYGFTIFGII